MAFATQCPACKLVDPPHKLVTRGRSKNLIQCKNCHATFNRFTYVYIEDPYADDDDEIEEFFLPGDFAEDIDAMDDDDETRDYLYRYGSEF